MSEETVTRLKIIESIDDSNIQKELIDATIETGQEAYIANNPLQNVTAINYDNITGVSVFKQKMENPYGVNNICNIQNVELYQGYDEIRNYILGNIQHSKQSNYNLEYETHSENDQRKQQMIEIIIISNMYL